MSDGETYRPDPLKGALAGLAAGLAAAIAMEGFQRIVAALSQPDSSEPATEKAADRASAATTGEPVASAVRPAAGQAVHYLTGIGLGIAYGVAAEYGDAVTAGRGAAFGTATAALLDEGAVPALGLGPAPWETPASTHAYSAAAHLVFGLVAEATRHAIRGR